FPRRLYETDMVVGADNRNQLYSLELQDFKSYRGKQTIGPFSKFTAIVGPNGSGKSNLMDAICFVLGEKANLMRVRKLTDLIHGAPIGKPVANKCHVSMDFIDTNGKHRIYTRRVVHGGCEYSIDNSTVTVQQYNQAMEELKIFIKAKNFLVYQGQVESIAMKNPKERTAMFEEISRSVEFANEYERLKAEMLKAENEAQSNMNKRRGIAAEKKEARLEREEAEKYQQLREELSTKQCTHTLMELFEVERLIKQTEEELEGKQENVNGLVDARKKAEDEQTEKHKEVKKHQKELHKLEKAAAEKEKEVSTKKPIWMQINEEMKHHAKKAEQAVKLLAAAKKMEEKNSQALKNLQEEEKRKKKEKEALKKQLEEEGDSQNLNLSQDQIDEYIRLKKQASGRSGAIDMELQREMKDNEEDHNRIAFEEKKLESLKAQKKTKEEEKSKKENQLRSIDDQIAHTEESIKVAENDVKNADTEVRKAKCEMEKMEHSLKEITIRLQDAQGDTVESEREKKKKEAIENLLRVFPDKVYGRLLDLCTPSHKRFNLAVTKLLQKHMNSIVCDTDTTAREAINYLKEQRYSTETFLPLSVLDVQPINERLRTLKKPHGVKLLYDVIQCPNNTVKKAVQYACGNALVVEDAEGARYLAYGEAGERHKAVALDGTLFNPSGLISGGGTDLKRSAKRWDDAAVKKLKSERTEIVEKITTIRKTRMKEMDIEMKNTNLNGLRTRVEYMKRDKNDWTTRVLPALETSLDIMQAEIDTFGIRINDIKDRMESRKQKIAKLEKDSAVVNDEVFADFCDRIGVADIREYENRDMKFHQEMKAKMLEFDNELDRIKNEIAYMQADERKSKASTEEEKLKALEKSANAKKKEEAKLKKALEGLEEDLSEIQMKIKAKRVDVEEMESELGEFKKAANAASREVTQAEKAMAAYETAISRRRGERHRLLRDAKINQIAIPLSAGSLADVDADDEDDDDGEGTSNGDQNASQVTQEQLKREKKIKINYRMLPEDFKALSNSNEVKKRIEKLLKEIAEAQEHLGKVQAPNLKAGDRLDSVKDSEEKVNAQFENARKKAKKVRTAFEKIKTDRYRRFQGHFEPVAQKIDEIYKQLSRDPSAQAFLGPDNTEEPYLEGIQYNCIAPGKRFRPMDNLSGGEKTVAALALLFAMHARNPSPFFVLDEIDAALDNTNIGKVASYIVDSARANMQLIVISLKEEFYNKADGLVGIHPIPANCTVSGVITVDLTPFKASGHDHSMMDTTNVPPPSER
ncbi:hypothetical protein PENTCL1PPCAC_13815, partial [Pristionchus entomophagus]